MPDPAEDLAAAVELAQQAELDRQAAADAAQVAALRRARAVARVVELAGSQTEAARLLGIAQPVVNGLVKKARRHADDQRDTRP